MLGKLSYLLSSADFFYEIYPFKNSFRNTIIMSNCLDQDQARHSVGPDLGPNCLQRLFAYACSRQIVNTKDSAATD